MSDKIYYRDNCFESIDKEHYKMAREGGKLYEMFRLGRTPIGFHKYWYHLNLYRTNRDQRGEAFDCNKIISELNWMILTHMNGDTFDIKDTSKDKIIEFSRARISTLIDVLQFNLHRLDDEFVFIKKNEE